MALVTALISAGGLVLGSVIGAVCSWGVNRISLNEQIRLQKENLDYQEKYKIQEKFTNANIIRLDLCTAIYQSIRCLQNIDDFTYLYSIHISKDYNATVASLCDEYSLKELSYIYQLYGMIEQVYNNIDIIEKMEFHQIISVRNLLKNIIKKVYGENCTKILSIDIEDISYEELYNDQLMKKGYREVFNSLDEICKRGYLKKKSI